MIVETNDFIKYLKKSNLSKNTIEAYDRTVKSYYSNYDEITKKNLLGYKGFLIENYKPKTVNLRIQGINKYLDFINKSKLKLTAVKIQQKTYLENVISNEDYNYLKTRLKRDKNYEWYFVVRYLAATGARISELIQLKIEHIIAGHFDIYSKGGKIRRIYIPKLLQEETIKFFNEHQLKSGFMFLNRYGKRISTRGIALQLKKFAIQYGIDTKVVYPHSFRHRFAKNFLEKYNDITFLADLMGHDSIETTRIYLRKTSTEQKEIVDKTITW